MRDESEWRRLSNAFPASLLRSASECARACVCFCECAKSIESSLKDEEHCLRRALVMLCAVFVDFSHSLKLPLLFQPNWSLRAETLWRVMWSKGKHRVEEWYIISESIQYCVISYLYNFISVKESRKLAYEVILKLEAINTISTVADRDLFTLLTRHFFHNVLW